MLTIITSSTIEANECMSCCLKHDEINLFKNYFILRMEEDNNQKEKRCFPTDRIAAFVSQSLSRGNSTIFFFCEDF